MELIEPRDGPTFVEHLQRKAERTADIGDATDFAEAADRIESLQSDKERMREENASLSERIDVLKEAERGLEKRADLLTEAAEAAIFALRNNGYAETAEILQRALLGIGRNDVVVGWSEIAPDHG